MPSHDKCGSSEHREGEKEPNTQIIKKDVIWDKDLKNAANSLCPFSSLLVNVCSKNHGFIAWLRLEGALKMILFYTPTYPSLVKVAIYQIKLPMTPYNPALNASRDGAATTSPGSNASASSPCE